MPKLNKSPTEERFIILAANCFLKPLPKVITAAFKTLFHQIESSNDQSQYISGINTFWKILKNYPVIKDISNRIKRTAAASISSFDFSVFIHKHFS